MIKSVGQFQFTMLFGIEEKARFQARHRRFGIAVDDRDIVIQKSQVTGVTDPRSIIVRLCRERNKIKVDDLLHYASILKQLGSKTEVDGFRVQLR